MMSFSNFFVVLCVFGAAQAAPQGLFGFQGPDINDQSQQLALGGAAVTGLVTALNVHKGNDKISFRPQANLVFNPKTGQLEPVITGNVQVGEGFGSTSFGVGGALGSEQGFKPVATSSINGPSIGGVATPALTSGIAFGQQESHGFAGVGVNSQHLSLDSGHSVGGLLGGNSNTRNQQQQFHQQPRQQFHQPQQQQFQQQPQQFRNPKPQQFQQQQFQQQPQFQQQQFQQPRQQQFQPQQQQFVQQPQQFQQQQQLGGLGAILGGFGR